MLCSHYDITYTPLLILLDSTLLVHYNDLLLVVGTCSYDPVVTTFFYLLRCTVNATLIDDVSIHRSPAARRWW